MHLRAQGRRYKWIFKAALERSLVVTIAIFPMSPPFQPDKSLAMTHATPELKTFFNYAYNYYNILL